jgi:2-dehydropantoate 2-reductase
MRFGSDGGKKPNRNGIKVVKALCRVKMTRQQCGSSGELAECPTPRYNVVIQQGTIMSFSYAIIGTGAVGGYYGACLQRSGAEVHFLLHSDFEQVRQNGLFIESKSGDFRLPRVHAYRLASDMPRCDVVIVALKTTQNRLLPELIPPAVKDSGCVLMLQNGLGVEDAAARLVGANRVCGGLSFICSTKTGPGHIHHLDYDQITLAEYSDDGQPKAVTRRLEQIAGDFRAAGIPVELSADLVLARWKKLVWNIPFNGLSVMLNATTDELLRAPPARALVEQLMSEVVSGAATLGRSIPDAFVEEMIARTRDMVPYRTSMKLDYDNHRPMEVEAIFGNPWRKAREAGLDMVRTGMLYEQLQVLDARNCPGV